MPNHGGESQPPAEQFQAAAEPPADNLAPAVHADAETAGGKPGSAEARLVSEGAVYNGINDRMAAAEATLDSSLISAGVAGLNILATIVTHIEGGPTWLQVTTAAIGAAFAGISAYQRREMDEEIQNAGDLHKAAEIMGYPSPFNELGDGGTHE